MGSAGHALKHQKDLFTTYGAEKAFMVII